MTGIVIGYNSTGSRTSRLRARTSIAANSVPTDAKPSVPEDEQTREHRRLLEECGVEQERHERNEHNLRREDHREDGGELAGVDRRAIGRREHQRPQRVRVTLALERAPERQGPRKRNRDPEDARRRVRDDATLLHQRECEHEHGGHREEQRRGDRLAAADLDGEVLAEDQPRGAREHRLSAPGRSPHGRPGAIPHRDDVGEPADLQHHRAIEHLVREVDVVSGQQHEPSRPRASARRRKASASDDGPSRPVKGSSSRTRRG
jgi:hypothetical protein